MTMKKLLSKVHDRVTHAGHSRSIDRDSGESTEKDKRGLLTRWRNKKFDLSLPPSVSRAFTNAKHTNTYRSSMAVSTAAFRIPSPETPHPCSSTTSSAKHYPLNGRSSLNLDQENGSGYQSKRLFSYSPMQRANMSVPDVIDALRFPVSPDPSEETPVDGASSAFPTTSHVSYEMDDDDQNNCSGSSASSGWKKHSAQFCSRDDRRTLSMPHLTFIPEPSFVSVARLDAHDEPFETRPRYHSCLGWTSLDGTRKTLDTWSKCDQQTPAIIPPTAFDNMTLPASTSLPLWPTSVMKNQPQRNHSSHGMALDMICTHVCMTAMSMELTIVKAKNTRLENTLATLAAELVLSHQTNQSLKQVPTGGTLPTAPSSPSVLHGETGDRCSTQLDESILMSSVQMTNHILSEVVMGFIGNGLHCSETQREKAETSRTDNLKCDPDPPKILHNHEQQDELLRMHTRAQLGLIEYLEGETDIFAAMARFKKQLEAEIV